MSQVLRRNWRNRFVLLGVALVAAALGYIAGRRDDIGPAFGVTGVVFVALAFGQFLRFLGPLLAEIAKIEYARWRGPGVDKGEKVEPIPCRLAPQTSLEQDRETIRETIQLLEQADQVGWNYLSILHHVPRYTVPGSIEDWAPGYFRGPQAIDREKDAQASREVVSQAVSAARTTAILIADSQARREALRLVTAQQTFFLSAWPVIPIEVTRLIHQRREAYDPAYSAVIPMLGERWRALGGQEDEAVAGNENVPGSGGGGKGDQPSPSSEGRS